MHELFRAHSASHMTPEEKAAHISHVRRLASLARKTFAPGSGAPRTAKRCKCGLMTRNRAKQRKHKC